MIRDELPNRSISIPRVARSARHRKVDSGKRILIFKVLPSYGNGNTSTTRQMAGTSTSALKIQPFQRSPRRGCLKSGLKS
jgi:hypothetical protein